MITSLINNEKQYNIALKRAYQLMPLNLKENSKQSDELELLSLLIEKYEEANYPIDPPHPIEAILFRLEQQGLKKSYLSKIFGTRGRTSEILNGKHKLSLGMIRKLNEQLNIPAEVLIRSY